MAEYYCDFRTAKSLDDLKIMLDRFFNWFFANLDSMNVTSITTDITNVQSEDGTTVIQGPVLVMKDGATVTRLQMGYDSTAASFMFKLSNEAGVTTVGIDSNGNVTITGTITGSTINGSTINGGDINVTSDVNIGKKLIFNFPSSYEGGIDFGNNFEIYVDPAGGSLYLQTPSGGHVYANGTQLDP